MGGRWVATSPIWYPSASIFSAVSRASPVREVPFRTSTVTRFAGRTVRVGVGVGDGDETVGEGDVERVGDEATIGRDRSLLPSPRFTSTRTAITINATAPSARASDK